MAASRQSYAEADVAAAMRTTYPEGLYQGRTGTTVNVAEDIEPESVSDEQQVMLTEEQIQEAFGDESTPIEEEGAIDVLLSWKQSRANIKKKKLSRGLGTAGPKDLKKIEARVRCFRCKRIGHFSKNCPKKPFKQEHLEVRPRSAT